MRESALYNYFAGKDALFDALLEAHQTTKSERLTAFAEGPIADGRALLEQLAITTLEGFVEPREQKLFRILMSDGVRLAKLGRINLYERMASGRVGVAGILGRLIREGWLRRADPDLLGIAFVSPLVLWRQLHAIDADLPMIRNPRAFARQHVDQFLQGAVGAVRAAAAPPAARARARRSHQRARPSPGVRRRNPEGAPPCFAHHSSSVVLAAALAAACDRADADSCRRPPKPSAVTVSAADVVEQPIKRFIRVSGTLTAQEEAEVAAEVAGRVVATPVERGSRVGANDSLVRLVGRRRARPRRLRPRPTPRRSRPGWASPTAPPFDVDSVPEVANAARGPAAGAHRVRAGPHAARSSSCCRRPSSISAARRPKRPSASTTWPATPRRSSTSRCWPRAPASRWRRRRWPTPRCGRRSPASSASASSRSATT